MWDIFYGLFQLETHIIQKEWNIEFLSTVTTPFVICCIPICYTEKTILLFPIINVFHELSEQILTLSNAPKAFMLVRFFPSVTESSIRQINKAFRDLVLNMHKAVGKFSAYQFTCRFAEFSFSQCHTDAVISSS